MRTTALIVDDEAQIRRVVANALRDLVTRTVEASAGRPAIDLAASERPDLIVLDLALPDMPGRDVCLEIRKWSTAPIIVLSARHSDQEKISLLDAGADDYVTKPFSAPELRARAKAQLRRARLAAAAGPEQVVRIGDVEIDLAKPGVRRGSTPVHLTRTEWDILRTLARHAGRTLTHQQIIRAVWGNVFGDLQQTLRVHIRGLRRKLEADPVRPAVIVTEPGVGYRLETGR
jgi:two-component system, OmpR family, KDP operon response regulator KdpE